MTTFNGIVSQYTDEVYTLLGSQSTHANIIKILRSTFAKAKADDAVIFFFSGHGYEGGFCCYDQKTKSYLGGMSYQELQILFRNCRARRKIVIADACFSGGVSKQRSMLTVQAVQSSDVIFFLSSRFDETSLELPEGPNGLFTYYLAKGIAGEADYKHDNKISIQEIYAYVNSNVVNYANQIPHSQHPTIWGRFEETTPILSFIGRQ